MKTKIFFIAWLLGITAGIFAQDRTTVTATNADISENLDLRAVASLFGDSENLEDFERRLNDPRTKISNLDLNGDREVDYLRVIESVERNTHLIIVQSVLGRDVFQDVATIEVERDRRNNVQVQVVGDTFLYGNNYIYEPVFFHRPMIYNTFWMASYRPYWSPWYWNYYPTYYYTWNPYPIYSYHQHVNVFVNTNHQYNYVPYRRSTRAVAMHNSRRANGYEAQYPNRSFAQRNSNVSNRYELAQRQATLNNTSRPVADATSSRNFTSRSENLVRADRNTVTRNESSAGTRSELNSTRETTISAPRTSTVRSTTRPSSVTSDRRRYESAVSAPRISQPTQRTAAQPRYSAPQGQQMRQQSAPLRSSMRSEAPAMRSASAPSPMLRSSAGTGSNSLRR